jgi:hypothetical protein
LGGKGSENGGQKGQSRILDLWIDMPQTNPVMQIGFLQQNFVRLDKDFQVMHKATRAQDLLIQSMTLMDQQVQQRVTKTSSSQGIDSSKCQKKQTSSEFESSQNNSENSSSLKEGKEEAKQSYMSSSSNKQSKCAACNSPGIY